MISELYESRHAMTFLATFFSFKEFICVVKSEKLTRYMALLRISLTCYPESIRKSFPMQLFQRSGCSKRLLLYIKNQIYKGVNFLKISEGIAALNHEEFMRLGEIHNAAIRDGLLEDEAFDELEFYANDLFAFPSSEQTTNLFLDNFKTYKNFYVSKMQNISATR